MAREVVVLSGVRTAIGDYGGSLKDSRLIELAAARAAEAVKRAGIEPAEVGHVVFGNVIHTSRATCTSRASQRQAGLPIDTPRAHREPPLRQRAAGHRLGGAAHLLGDADCAVAGGAESMSRARTGLPTGRFGQRMGDAPAPRRDGRRAHRSLRRLPHGHDGREHRGEVAHLARGAGRVRSRATAARRARSKRLVHGADRPRRVARRGKGTMSFDKDEHVRKDATLEDMRSSARVQEGGRSPRATRPASTTGRGRRPDEAASAQERGLKPMARLVGYAHAGVDRDHGHRPDPRRASA